MRWEDVRADLPCCGARGRASCSYASESSPVYRSCGREEDYGSEQRTILLEVWHVSELSQEDVRLEMRWAFRNRGTARTY